MNKDHVQVGGKAGTGVGGATDGVSVIVSGDSAAAGSPCGGGGRAGNTGSEAVGVSVGS